MRIIIWEFHEIILKEGAEHVSELYRSLRFYMFKFKKKREHKRAILELDRLV